MHVFQREPGWVEPKHEREYSPRERWLFRNVPLAQRLHRAWIFHKGNRRFRGYDVGSSRQRRMRALCEAFIAGSITDPATRAAVTPDYPWGCKRPVLSSTFYPTLNRDNVELVPHAVRQVTPTGVIDATGTARDVDVLILSTGFQPTRFLASLDVKGRDGRSIHDVWRERASAFLGITVPGFPNFFILYGPNTNGGVSVIAQLDALGRLVLLLPGRDERGDERRARALELHRRRSAPARRKRSTAAIAEAATTSTPIVPANRFLRVTKAFIAPLEAPFGFVWTTKVSSRVRLGTTTGAQGREMVNIWSRTCEPLSRAGTGT